MSVLKCDGCGYMAREGEEETEGDCPFCDGGKMKFMGCEICNSTGWVCENHRDMPWGEEEGECKCGAGKNCICNPDGYIEMTAVYASVSPEKVKTWVH